MQATLYVIPGSHPARAARLILERKGIGYRRVDLIPLVSRLVLRGLRFPGATVPALKLDGRRIQGSRTIARELERLVPEPPVFPAEPAARAAVEEAERWGDEVLQDVGRRVLWNALRRDRSALAEYARGAKLGVPVGLAVRTSAPLVALSVRLNEADDEHVRADLAALPAMLDQIDEWIEAGLLGSEPANAADFQIATGIRLLLTLADLREAIESRPAGELALRLVPEYPGRVGPVFPASWLEPLRTPQPAAA